MSKFSKTFSESDSDSRPISRRDFMGTSLATTMGAVGASMMPQTLAQVLAASGSRQPNIIFIFSDDHACQAISAYGSKINKTPQIDRLAKQGMLFRNSFCGNSICAPSRATVLTGTQSNINGQTGNGGHFDGSQITFPKLLRNSGYQTGLIGKWHLKSKPTGFDHWEVLPGQGHYYNPTFETAHGGKQQTTGYVTDLITDRSLDWLKARQQSDKPYLLMCQHKAVHRWWMPGPNHLTMYDDQKIPEPETLFDDHKGKSDAADQSKMSIAHALNKRDLKLNGPPDRMTDKQKKQWNEAYHKKNEAFRQANLSGDDLVRWKYQRYIKDYLRCVASLDDNVGRIIDYVDQSPQADNTVLIYCSDQGFFLGEHGWFDKRWMYEPSLKMPLIVRWPNVVPAGRENTDLVQNIDYAPTFLDMAGVKTPSRMQGRSLMPLLKGKSPDNWRDAIYYHYFEFPRPHHVRPHYGVRTQRYKLIYFYTLDQWEFYDLKKDPKELNNLYGNEAYAAITKRLKQKLKSLRIKYKDTAGAKDESSKTKKNQPAS